MALVVRHGFSSSIPDDPASQAAGEVLPSHWNADHAVTGTLDITDVDGLDTALSGKQDTLVSGVNIKTVNGSSLLGVGDLTVSGANGARVSVDFGASFTDKAQTVVTGQTWVTVNSNIAASVLTPADTDPDEMYLLNIRPVVSGIVAGTGFTITLYSEPEAKGTYDVMCAAA